MDIKDTPMCSGAEIQMPETTRQHTKYDMNRLVDLFDERIQGFLDLEWEIERVGLQQLRAPPGLRRMEGRMKTFNPRPLLAWMRRRGIDASQMAEMIQMDKLTVKNILSGRVDPRLGTMAAIHRVTKIPYDMMIRTSEE